MRVAWCSGALGAIGLLFGAGAAWAQQLPAGGAVTSGNAAIVRSNPSTLNINQSSDKAIINWQSFSVGHGGTVNFNQPGASSATLNRVLGSTPSWIAGTINAPGTVLLVNPNGIAITKSGIVNTGSFAASTLDIKDSDFLAGHYKFTGNGGSAGVVNNGHINVSDGGFAALLGGQVSNNGVIAARLGKVGLGAGELITLDLAGDGFLSVAVPSSQLGKLVNAKGALVSNRGKIKADGGTVYLSAATAANILRNAVNIPGSIRANTVGVHDGRIVINGGGGQVKVTGRLAAKGRHQGETGGRIDIASANIRVLGALIDASGAAGGGIVEIGGGLHGGGDLAHAQSVSIESTTVIRADALDSGNGGVVVAWSDGQTDAHGTFSARGGPNGGNGGTIETSGHSVDFTGIRVNASATYGAAGTWLVDPTTLTIDSAAATTIANTLNSGTSVTLQTNPDGTTSGPGTASSGAGDIIFASGLFAPGGNNTTLTVQAYNNIVINGGGSYVSIAGSFVAQAGGSFTLNGSLFAKNVTITTIGDMSFNGDLEPNPGTATLTAGGSIYFGGSVNSLGGNPILNAGGDIQILAPVVTGAGATLNAYGNINIAANFTNYGAGSVTLRTDADGSGSGTLTFSNGATFAAGGAAVTIYYNPTSYASPDTFGSVTGAGSLTAYMLVNSAANLQAISNNLSGTYALGRDIDLSGVDFMPIGWTATVHNFTGLFDGQNHVIYNMAIGAQTEHYFLGQTGLFWENDGTIRNLGVTGSISDGTNSYIGGLAGVVGSTGTISNSWSAVSVSGNRGDSSVGGLVGLNFGHITGDSYATGSVHGGYYVGGLVGENRGGGVIEYSYATGAVDGQYAGGLVGWNRTGALINYTYALGSVHGTGYTGGLVGENEQYIATYGAILNSYAAGHLTGSTIGGLVGRNDYPVSANQDDFNSQIGQSGKVWWSIWDADSTGTNKAFGSSYLDRPGYSSENVQFIGLVSANSSLTSANGGGNLGNPYQTSSYNYFFSDPTPGNTGMQATGFAAHWYMVDGATRPFLSAEYSTTIQNAHQLQLIDMNGSASYALARDLTYTNDGMWTSAGFSPIAPQTALNVETKSYGVLSFNNIGSTSSQTQSGSNVIVVVINSGPQYPVSQTLLSDTYAVNYVAQNFTGTFNGNGHTISNLFENTSGIYAGLFGTIASGGNVDNLGIVNSLIAAYNTPSAGILAANNQGSINNSWVTNSTLSTSVVNYVGGLVGANAGFIGDSYTSARVSGLYQNTTTNFNQFYDIDGGLVGYNYGTINNAYAVGSVYGNGQVGGLAGSNGGTIINTYTTAQTYQTYSGYGINYVGPLVGDNYATVQNSYWDSTVATHMDNTGWGNAGTGRTTAQMQDLNSFQTNYAGWDFFRVWAPPNQAGQGGQSIAYYPELYASSNIVVLAANNASQQYGAATPALVGGLYSLGDVGRLRSYSIGTLSSSATSSSSVGTYSIGLQSAIPATGVGRTTCSGFCEFDVTINGYDLNLGNVPSVNSAASLINSYTRDTGVTASVDAGGHLVLTAARSITATVGNSYYDPYGIAGYYPYTPTATVSASMMNGSTPRTLFFPGTLTVTPAPLTVTATSFDKTYGQTVVNGSLGYTPSGLINGDSVRSVSFSSSGLAATANVDGGPYTITPSNAVGTGLSNYTITYVNGTLTINPATLTYTANSATMTYGATVPGLGGTVTGFVNGETLGTATTGTASFATNATSLSNVGNYYIDGSGLTANHGNYVFVQAAANATAFSVTPATYTAISGSKTYDGNTGFASGEVILTGVNGETFIVAATANSANASSNPNNPATSFTGTSGPITGIGGANPNNYGNLVVSSLTGANNVATINVASYTAISGSKTYDGNTGFASNEVTLTGVNGETFNVAATANSANASSNPTDPATYFTGTSGPIAGIGGADPNNYSNLVVSALTGGNNVATINVASYTAISGSKTYDGNTGFFSGETILAGVNGETFNVAATANSANASSNPNNPATYFTGTSGPIAGIGGTDPNNYSNLVVSSLTGGNNVATVNVANYTAISGSKTYDGNTGFASGEVILTGVNGETFNAAASANSANATSNPTDPATYFTRTSGPIAGIGGADPNNYNFLDVSTLTGGNNTALISTRSLTITADDAAKTYGQTFTFAGTEFTPTGLQNGETIGSVALVSAGQAATAGVAGGPYAIVAGNATGGTFNTGNYAITYVDGHLTVNPADVVVTALGGSSVYGQSPTNPGISAAGLQNGQDVSVLNGLSNSFGIGPTTSVAGGPYTLSVLGTLTNVNYAITARNTGTWVVTPAPITVTANGGTSVYGSSPADPGLSASGLQNGESVSVLNGLSNSFGIGPTTSVAGGPYTLSVLGTLTNANYAITARNTGTWTVTPAQIVVTANGGTSVYGQSPSDPGISASGLQNGQDVSVLTGLSNSFGIGPTASVAGGPYTLSVLGILTNANYAITARNTGTWVVTPAPITVTANGGTSVYGSSPTNPGISAAGLQNGEGISALTGLYNSFGITNLTGVGNHTLAVAGMLTNPNYQVTSTVNGTWTVDPATLTYVANPSSRYFGDPNPVFSGTVTGFVNGETLATATTGTLQFTSPATPGSLVGPYPIDGSGLSAANYVFVQAASNATALTVGTPPTNPGSQVTPPPGGNTPSNNVNISFQNSNTGGTPVQVSFTPTSTASNRSDTDVAPAALPPGNPLAGNNGLNFLPISQYDANQYSQFKLPDYDAKAGAATIFTIIARAISPDHAADFLIDKFWNGAAGDWKGAGGNNPLAARVTYSDGDGHDVAPTDADAFPIVSGKTDLAQLLMSGPVMIGGPAGQVSGEWLLAIGLAPNGKGIICDDPITGRQVMLSYDPATEILGGISGIFDAKTKGFVALADAGTNMPAGISVPAALQSFVPSTYFSVAIH